MDDLRHLNLQHEKRLKNYKSVVRRQQLVIDQQANTLVHNDQVIDS